MAARTEILWRSDALGSMERCVIMDAPGTECIEGTAVVALHDTPASIDYAIDAQQDWSVVAARIALTVGADERSILLDRTDGRWFVDGLERPDLAACRSVDLGWSPATNTLPLRTEPLAIGESSTSFAAWVRFPELDVVASEQTYTRLSVDRVRYSSATFTAELAMTQSDVVTTYGDDLWHADQVRYCS